MSLLDPLRALLQTPEAAALGPGPRSGVRSVQHLERQLTALFSSSDLPGQRRILIKALLLLWHDHLEASHALSQQVGSVDGSYVHGLMHRREPDYGNAKYWFGKVGQHPAYPILAGRASRVLESPGAGGLVDMLMPEGRWDPFAMVDLCESLAGTGGEPLRRDAVTALQAAEFEVLLGYLSG